MVCKTMLSFLKERIKLSNPVKLSIFGNVGLSVSVLIKLKLLQLVKLLKFVGVVKSLKFFYQIQ